MEKQKETKVIAVLALLIAIVGISVGFAAMSTTLNIQGTAEMRPANWSIKFASLGTPTLVNDADVIVAPTINGNATVLSDFDVKLVKPGSKVVYTFDLVNDGTIDAKISNVLKAAKPKCVGTGDTALADATLVCENLVYTLKYTTGGALVSIDDTLNAGVIKNVTLTLEYPAIQTLPNDVVEISDLGIKLIYVQS